MIFGLVWLGGLVVESVSPSYKGHRYPAEVIAHCVWLYFRFPLSYREVEELMLQRGVIVSYETIAVVPEVRSGLRRRPAAPPAPGWGQVALRFVGLSFRS